MSWSECESVWKELRRRLSESSGVGKKEVNDWMEEEEEREMLRGKDRGFLARI